MFVCPKTIELVYFCWSRIVSASDNVCTKLRPVFFSPERYVLKYCIPLSRLHSAKCHVNNSSCYAPETEPRMLFKLLTETSFHGGLQLWNCKFSAFRWALLSVSYLCNPVAFPFEGDNRMAIKLFIVVRSVTPTNPEFCIAKLFPLF